MSAALRIDRDPRRQAAVDGHHVRDPVQRPGEVDDARCQAEQEGPARVGWAPAERDEQRRERDPAECGMAELRETERQEDARRER